tara:strand:- start:1613 stop:1876 length:264 start_codon:yes stop_codon:yes gene_type:complete
MKNWYKSKTMWINTLTLLAGVIAVVSQSELLKEHTELVIGLTTIALPLVNLFLRWLTDQPITSPVKQMNYLRPRIEENIKANRYMVK